MCKYNMNEFDKTISVNSQSVDIRVGYGDIEPHPIIWIQNFMLFNASHRRNAESSEVSRKILRLFES